MARKGDVFAYIAFINRARDGARVGKASSIYCCEQELNAFFASMGTMTKSESCPCIFINIRASCTTASIADGIPFASCCGARYSLESDMAAGRSTFVTSLRRTCPIIGQVLRRLLLRLA